jgi:hypothetical protein
MIDLYRTCGHAVRARRCLRRQLELPPPQHLWPGCEVRSPPMLAAKIDRPIRHADVLSKYPGVSCQSSLHLDTDDPADAPRCRLESCPDGCPELPGRVTTASSAGRRQRGGPVGGYGGYGGLSGGQWDSTLAYQVVQL